MIRLWIIALCLVLTGCPLVIKDKAKTNYNATVELVVLGNVQDAGSPHIGCIKSCCEHLHESPDQSRKVVSLGVVDHLSKTKYLFDATPDMTAQLEHLNKHRHWFSFYAERYISDSRAYRSLYRIDVFGEGSD